MNQYIIQNGLEKLTKPEVEKILVLSGLDNQAKIISLELGWIQIFLQDTLRKEVRDVSHWVDEVKVIANSIEDAIDSALISFSEQKISSRFKKGHAFKDFRDQVNQIYERITEISERIKGIDNLEDSDLARRGSSVVHTEVQIPDPKPVELRADIDEIVRQLLDKRITRRSVVSIWGPGGLGKTTLAKTVYNRVRGQFEYQIWVEISQNFRPTNLLREILKTVPEKSRGDLKRDLEVLSSFLKLNKYLIVLDGVWTDLVWTQMEEGLPDENNGSRVLITTRFKNVATDADPKSKPYKAQFFNKDLSLELLRRDEKLNQSPEGMLDDLAELIVKKSGGLPLALRVLGDVLSEKFFPNNWKEVMEKINWNTDGRKCIDEIGTSYQILPSELKSCFLYLASFPENCEIDAKTLVSLWIKEEIITITQEKGNMTEEPMKPEAVAEKYLEQLVQRSMIEVIKWCSKGTIQSCQVLPAFLSLAMSEAKDKGFIHYSNKETIDISPFGAKRKVFHHSMMKSSLNLSELSEGFERMNSLKHLSFKNFGKSVEIPKNIHDLKNLETLDVRGTFVRFLSESLWEITKLISVRASDWIHLDGPPSSKELLNLQTLKIVQIHKTWGKKFPNLPAIRKLGLSYFKNPNDPNGVIDWNLVIRFLGKFSSLESLKIQGKDIPAELIDAKTSITRLWLGGSRSQFDLDKAQIPQSLVMFTLESLEFKKDPMLDLGKLSNLKTLRLRWLLFTASDGQMNCSDQGFPQLESLELYHITGLREWSVANGGMQNIKYVLIESCKTMEKLPDLNHCKPQIKSCPFIKV